MGGGCSPLAPGSATGVRYRKCGVINKYLHVNPRTDMTGRMII